MMDTGLHYKGKSRAWALQMFEEYAWDTSDVASKEVTRYQSLPGQAVTYMLGQLFIIRLKKRAQEALKEKFNIKDFHYQVIYVEQVRSDCKCYSKLASHNNKAVVVL